jgi:hypothetical protein
MLQHPDDLCLHRSLNSYSPTIPLIVVRLNNLPSFLNETLCLIVFIFCIFPHLPSGAILFQISIRVRAMATCNACSNIFTQKNAIKLLKSRDGLEYRRDGAAMLTTALESCIMFGELLCNGSVRWEDPSTGSYRTGACQFMQGNNPDITMVM